MKNGHEDGKKNANRSASSVDDKMSSSFSHRITTRSILNRNFCYKNIEFIIKK